MSSWARCTHGSNSCKAPYSLCRSVARSCVLGGRRRTFSRRTSENAVWASSWTTSPTTTLVLRGLVITLAPLAPYRREHRLGGIQLVYDPLSPGLDRVPWMAHLHRRADHEGPGVRVRLGQGSQQFEAVPVRKP